MNADTDMTDKLQRFQNALDEFIEKLKQDRYVLATVLIGSLSPKTIWHKDGIGLWIIEQDGVEKRHASDGKNERLFRTFAEDDINLHAEVIPRSRFKRMIEGASRTAFTHSFFAKRILLYSHDESIARWFNDANTLATKDQADELFIATAHLIHAARHAERLLMIKQDLVLTFLELIGAAYGLAVIEIIRHGEVYEDEIIYRAHELNPKLIDIVYTDLMAGPRTPEKLTKALNQVQAFLDEHGETYLQPLLRYLAKESGTIPLSVINDHYAHSRLYPWHLEAACEWLAERGVLEKLSAAYRVTTKSRAEVEEPAYYYEPAR